MPGRPRTLGVELRGHPARRSAYLLCETVAVTHPTGGVLSTARAAVLSLIVALALSACGGHSGDDASSPSKGDYCTLVRQAKDSVSPSVPKGLSGNPSPAEMRRWIDDLAKPALARIHAIIAAAPTDAVPGWQQIRKLEQNMIDGLRGLATQQNAASWARMSRQQRLTKLLGVLSAMGDGVDRSAIKSLQAQVEAYCGFPVKLS